jgi:hypothetical protein
VQPVLHAHSLTTRSLSSAQQVTFLRSRIAGPISGPADCPPVADVAALSRITTALFPNAAFQLLRGQLHRSFRRLHAHLQLYSRSHLYTPAQHANRPRLRVRLDLAARAHQKLTLGIITFRSCFTTAPHPPPSTVLDSAPAELVFPVLVASARFAHLDSPPPPPLFVFNSPPQYRDNKGKNGRWPKSQQHESFESLQQSLSPRLH